MTSMIAPTERVRLCAVLTSGREEEKHLAARELLKHCPNVEELVLILENGAEEETFLAKFELQRRLAIDSSGQDEVTLQIGLACTRMETFDWLARENLGLTEPKFLLAVTIYEQAKSKVVAEAAEAFLLSCADNHRNNDGAKVFFQQINLKSRNMIRYLVTSVFVKRDSRIECDYPLALFQVLPRDTESRGLWEAAARCLVTELTDEFTDSISLEPIIDGSQDPETVRLAKLLLARIV